MDIENKDLDKLIEDIKFIRGSISKNIRVLREINFSSQVKYSSLFFGLSLVVIPMVYLFFLVRYGNITRVPLKISLITALVFFISVFLSWLVKFQIYDPLKKIFNERSFVKITIYLMGKNYLFFYGIMVAVAVIICIYMILFSIPQFIIIVLSIAFGLFLLTFGLNLEITEYTVTGLWFLITSLAGLPVVEFYPRFSLVVAGASPGLGCIVFYFITQFRIFSKKG